MLIFWIVVALLVLLALWFVLPSLLQTEKKETRGELRAANVSIYQDQSRELDADLKNGLISHEQYEREKEELERRLLEDVKALGAQSASNYSSPATRNLAYGVALAIPIAAVALYFAVGNPGALTPSAATADMPLPASQQGGVMTPQQIEANVAKLSRRLEANPNDAQGWVMLGRSYMVLERFSDAVSAYGRATALDGSDANVWADYAMALARSSGQQIQLAGKPLEAANRALQLDPKNEKALAIAGSAAFEAKDYRRAIEYWQRLLPLLPADSELSKTVSDQIAKAKELAAGRGSR